MKEAEKKEAPLSKLDIEIGERLKEFRKSLPTKYSQARFSEELGITQSTCSLYELGKNQIPKGIRTLLEKQFGMNLVWLDTGKGSMFMEDVIDKITNIYFKLNEENKKLVLDIIKQTYIAQEHQEELDSL
ncbi:MAG: helix-turn-helix domain-containing protein [Candidatus Ornithospirochaeta sp.]|jgi:predicted transcriptional regulator